MGGPFDLPRNCTSLYFLFGKDPYSYVRVDNVARKVLKYCELNKNHLDVLLEYKINNSILTKLNAKTKNKYAKTITDVQSKVHELVADTLKVKKAEADAKANETAAKAEVEKQVKETDAKVEALTKQMLELEKKDSSAGRSPEAVC